MKLKLAIILLTWLTTATIVNSARILGIFLLPGPSHYILGSSLMRGLAEQGHDVTMISPFSEKTLPKNGTYRDIVLTNMLEVAKERKKHMNMFDRTNASKYLFTIFMNMIGAEMTEIALKDEIFQNLLNSRNESFDAVIVEQFGNDAVKGLAKHFNAPLILLSSMGANRWFNDFVGNPSPLSYVPDMMLSYSSQMTFFQRMDNVCFYVYNYLFDHLIKFPQQQKLLKKYISSSLDLYDILYNVSIVLINSHPSVNQPVPYVPAMIDIGGYHIKPPKKLPQDLQDYLDQAKDGAIYFSMGSNLKSKELPQDKREALLKSFSKLKQKVLWKWEDDQLPGQPSNVKTGKWLPQQDILAHPNVKLFISHGGLLSTTETVYHGVPVLIIPVFGDQKLNAAAVVNNGYGLSLSYDEIQEDKLDALLDELLNNPKYRDNAKKRSQLSQDRPLKPLENAVYWVEYVIRHKGAPHLRIAGIDLPWYKYMLLDIVAFITVIVLVSIVVSYKIFKKFLSCKIFRKKTEKIKYN